MKKTPEHFIQCAIVSFLGVALHPDAVFFAVPNGGKRDKITAAIMKREGVKAGVSDVIVIARTRTGYLHVIGLEVKAPKGSLTPEQKDFGLALRTAGGGFYCVRSIEDVAAALAAEGVPLRAIPSTVPGRLYQST